jgi:hypothetical protein
MKTADAPAPPFNPKAVNQSFRGLPPELASRMQALWEEANERERAERRATERTAEEFRRHPPRADIEPRRELVEVLGQNAHGYSRQDQAARLIARMRDRGIHPRMSSPTTFTMWRMNGDIPESTPAERAVLRWLKAEILEELMPKAKAKRGNPPANDYDF